MPVRWLLLMILAGFSPGQAPQPSQPAVLPEGEAGFLWSTGTAMREHPDGGGLVEVSPSGSLVAMSGGSSGAIVVLDSIGESPSSSSVPDAPHRVSVVLRGHSAPVLCMSLMARTGLLASGSEDGTVRIWNARQTGESARAPIRDAKDWVTGVAWLSQSRLVSASLDGKLRWYGVSKESSGAFMALGTSEHDHPITAMAVDPVTQMVATADDQNVIRIWADPKSVRATLKGHQGTVTSLTWTHGSVLASSSHDRTVRIWDTRAQACRAVLKGHAGWVSDVAFTDGGHKLVSTSWDRTVRLWDWKNGRQIAVVGRHPEPVVSCGANHQGHVITGGGGGRLRLWPLYTQRVLSFPRAHDGPVYHGAITADGARLLTASVDHTANVWETATGRLVTRLRGHGRAVTGVAVTRDGRHAATACADRLVRVWDSETGELVWTLRGHDEPVNCCAFSPDGKMLASGGRDDSVLIWDLSSGALVGRLKGHADDVKAVAWHPGGRLVGSVSDDGSLRVWDSKAGGEPRVVEAHPAPVHTIAFRPDGEVVVTGALDETLKFWKTDDLTVVRSVDGFGRGVNTAEWDHAGRRVVASSSDGHVKIVDALSGKVVKTLPRHQLACTWAGFDAGGELVASSSVDGSVRLDRVSPTVTIRRYPSTAGATTGVAFGPKGALYSTHEDGGLRRWDLEARRQVWVAGGNGPVCVARLGKWLASGSPSEEVWVRSLPDGETVSPLSLGSAPVALVPAHDDRLLVALTEDGRVVAIAPKRGASPTTWSLPSAPVGVAAAPNGDHVAVACAGGEIAIVYAETGETIETLRAAGKPTCVAWAPDSRWIVVGDEDGDIDAFGRRDVDGQRTRMPGHGYAVAAVAFDGAKARLVAAYRDGTAITWNVDRARSTSVSVGGGWRASCVAADPLGRWAAVGHEEGLLFTMPGGTRVGTARAFGDRQWVMALAWNLKLYRGTAGGWVRVLDDGAWKPLVLPASDEPHELTVGAFDAGRDGSIRVTIANEGTTPVIGLRVVAQPRPGLSVLVSGSVARLEPGRSCSIGVEVLAGDPKQVRLVLRHRHGEEEIRVR